MQSMYPDFSSMTVPELLAITLRESSNSEAITGLSNCFTLKELTEATICELSAIKGMGKRKATALLAAVELAKRLSFTAPGNDAESIRSPQDVAALVMNEMRYLDREPFRVLLLNTKNHVFKNHLVSIGALNSSLVHPREVFKQAIKNSAAAVILIHNHPSGCCTPSQEDIEITKRLTEAGKFALYLNCAHTLPASRFDN